MASDYTVRVSALRADAVPRVFFIYTKSPPARRQEQAVKKAPTIGGIVESRCGKCNDVTGHVVMAIVGGAIVKVECRSCGSVHRYRPAGKEIPPKTSATGTARATAGVTAGSRSPARGAQAKAEAIQWEKAAQRAINDEVLPYTVQGRYETGSLVRHPVFGLGEVRLFVPPDKMDVLFEDGLKRLLCNK